MFVITSLALTITAFTCSVLLISVPATMLVVRGAFPSVFFCNTWCSCCGA
jgi:hypothetical protein